LLTLRPRASLCAAHRYDILDAQLEAGKANGGDGGGGGDKDRDRERKSHKSSSRHKSSRDGDREHKPHRSSRRNREEDDAAEARHATLFSCICAAGKMAIIDRRACSVGPRSSGLAELLDLTQCPIRPSLLQPPAH